MCGRSVTACALAVVPAVGAWAGGWDCFPQERAKLMAADRAAGDMFGRSAAWSGNTALIGAFEKAIDGVEYAGAAYVFVQRPDGTWDQQARLTAGDFQYGDRFGGCVALWGDTALIGAPGHGTRGAAYVFQRSADTWVQEATLTVSDVVEAFGRCVLLADGTAYVSAARAPGEHAYPGVIYVFERNGESWTQAEPLTPSDGSAGDGFGMAMDIWGDTLLAGAPWQDLPGVSDAGATYLFERVGGQWQETARLTAYDAGASDNFGRSVAVRNNVAVVGAPLNDHSGLTNVGAVYLYTRAPAGWVFWKKLVASDARSGDEFGWTVALTDDRILIGAPWDSYLGERVSVGSVYVFIPGRHGWEEGVKLAAADGGVGDSLGYSLAAQGHSVLAGAAYDNHPGARHAGSAYVFDAECVPCNPCDMTCDGTVNGRDIQPLCELLAGVGWPCSECAADINVDGSINGDDIAALIDCLSG